MNFFGHAWVAGWFSQDQPFVLGAMLPDLANLLRLTAPVARHPSLAAGVRLHHQTDRAFHQSEVFVALERRGRSTLAALGLPKGARRALAHVGVEFLIDEQLAQRAPAWSGYTTALQFGGGAACRSALAWGSVESEQRFASLCQRLATPSRRADSSALAARLLATLAGRPRLELEPEAAAPVRDWLKETEPLVAAGLPELLSELEARLRAGSGAPSH